MNPNLTQEATMKTKLELMEETVDQLNDALAAARRERDEAVGLLRRMASTYDHVVIGGRCAICNNDRTRFQSADCQNCESAAFLARLSQEGGE